MRAGIIAIVGLLCVCHTQSADAHHSLASEFDESKPLTSTRNPEHARPKPSRNLDLEIAIAGDGEVITAPENALRQTSL